MRSDRFPGGPTAALLMCVLFGCSSSSSGGAPSDSAGACDRAEVIKNQLLAMRDLDAQKGLIEQLEPPCNLSSQAKVSLGNQRAQQYADGCANYESAAKTCNGPFSQGPSHSPVVTVPAEAGPPP